MTLDELKDRRHTLLIERAKLMDKLEDHNEEIRRVSDQIYTLVVEKNKAHAPKLTTNS